MIKEIQLIKNILSKTIQNINPSTLLSLKSMFASRLELAPKAQGSENVIDLKTNFTLKLFSSHKHFGVG